MVGARTGFREGCPFKVRLCSFKPRTGCRFWSFLGLREFANGMNYCAMARTGPSTTTTTTTSQPPPPTPWSTCARNCSQNCSQNRVIFEDYSIPRAISGTSRPWGGGWWLVVVVDGPVRGWWSEMGVSGTKTRNPTKTETDLIPPFK